MAILTIMELLSLLFFRIDIKNLVLTKIKLESCQNLMQINQV